MADEPTPKPAAETPPAGPSQPTPTPSPTPAPEPTPEPQPAEQSVPYDRFKAANEKAKAAAKEAADLKAQLEGLEDKDKSDVERLTKRAEKAEQEATSAAERLKNVERGGWLRAAASQAGFHDPDDAVVRANLDDIEDEKDAERFVKSLATSKKHLVKSEEERPGLHKVGTPVPGQQPNGGQPQSNIDLDGEAKQLAEGLKQYASKS